MFKKHWMVLLGGYLIYMMISFGVNYVPLPLLAKSFGTLIYSIFISPALMAGFILLYLNAGRDTNPSITDLYKGFNRYGTVMGTYWLSVIVLMFAMIPSFIYIVMLFPEMGIIDPTNFIEFYTSSLFFKLFAFMMINMFMIYIVFVRFLFYYFVLVDDPQRPVMETFKESARLLKGNSLNFIYYIMISALLMLVGLVLFIIPGLIMSFVVGLGAVRFYEKLKAIKQKPPFTVTHDPM